MRRANWLRLRRKIMAIGEDGLARVSIGARVSVSTLEKMCAGTYPNVPREALRERLCKFLDVSEDELFPLVNGERNEAS